MFNKSKIEARLRILRIVQNNKSKIEARLRILRIVQNCKDKVKIAEKFSLDELMTFVRTKLAVLASGDEFLLE